VRRPRNQLRCDSTRLKIKEEKKTENRAFLTARCHNEGRFSREVSGQDRPQSCRRNSPADLLVRPPLPQQVSPSLGIVRTPEETPSRTREGVTAQQDGRLRHFRGVPFGLGRVGAARNLERKGGTSPPQSDGSEWNRGPHVPKRNVRSPPTLRDLTTDRRPLNRTQVRKSRRRAGGKGKPGETQSQSRRQRQGTVLFLSYVEEQKLRFQGGSHSATLRGSFRLASSKVAGPVPRRCRWSAHVGRRAVPQRPSPATAEPDAFSELDRGPLGGGTPPITASGATAGILSGPHAHPPEPAVSGTVNRAGPVTDRDTRRNFFLIPLDVS